MHQFRGVFCTGLQYRVTRPSLHRRDKPSDPVGDHSQPIDGAVLRLRDDGWTNFPGEVQVSKKKGSEPTLDEQSKHASSRRLAALSKHLLRRRSLPHHYERSPVCRMRLVRLALVDHRQHGAA